MEEGELLQTCAPSACSQAALLRALCLPSQGSSSFVCSYSSPKSPAQILLPILRGLSSAGDRGPCVHELMPCLLAECFLMLPLKQFSPFTAFSPPKGKQRYLKLIRNKQQRSRGEGLDEMPGGSTSRRFMDMAWQLAVAYHSTGNFIKRSILLPVNK